MKTGIISINPEFADRIFDGSKKYEFRRKAPRVDSTFRLLVYATAPRRALIGEIVVSQVITDTPPRLWARTSHAAGIDEERFVAYFQGLDQANALEIETTKRFPAARPLEELRAVPGGFHPPRFMAWLSPERVALLGEGTTG